MEYLPGGDLYQRLADKGTLPLSEAVAWVAQAVLAIEDLHALNIVHRDVKPGKPSGVQLLTVALQHDGSPASKLVSFLTRVVQRQLYSSRSNGPEVEVH